MTDDQLIAALRQWWRDMHWESHEEDQRLTRLECLMFIDRVNMERNR